VVGIEREGNGRALCGSDSPATDASLEAAVRRANQTWRNINGYTDGSSGRSQTFPAPPRKSHGGI